jgi:hypothetical protein
MLAASKISTRRAWFEDRVVRLHTTMAARRISVSLYPTVKAPEGKMDQKPATNAQAPQTATDGKALTTEQEKKAFGPSRTDTPR